MADSRSAVCSSRLILRALRFGVAQADQDSVRGGRSAGQTFEYIHRNQHHRRTGQGLPGRGHRNTAVADGAAGLRALRYQQAERGGRRENRGHRLPWKIRAVAAKKLLDGAGRKYQTQFAIENECSVLQVLQ